LNNPRRNNFRLLFQAKCGILFNNLSFLLQLTRLSSNKSKAFAMTWQTHFILNDKEVCSSDPPGLLVLDYVRRHEKLVGTKEGCREGDCGACTVLIGELQGNRVNYKPVTSCLMPLGELQGKHLVTIEGLNLAHLSPVQQAIVDEGGTQCGFCTPGIVVSLTGYLMEAGTEIGDDDMKYALSGHLCRCTGYSSLKRAGNILVNSYNSNSDLKKSSDFAHKVNALIKNKFIPDYFKEIAARLRKLPKPDLENGQKTADYFIAGGTDIYVQKGETLPESRVHVLNLHPEMKGISKKNGAFHVGALTTFEEFAVHSDIIQIIPDIQEYMHLIASWQIRTRATLGGNIVNASPIGDMTVLLLALESDLILKEGDKQRKVPITAFFRGYKDLDKTDSEILTEIIFPAPSSPTKIHFEKVSKRKCLDIASVNSAIKVRCEGGVIAEIGVAMGGVAPIPLFLSETCQYFRGKAITKETILGAFPVALGEISPISDVRGSAEYKRLLVRQLLIAHFTKLFPEQVKVRDFYETY
jgi:xanthine dehydrogenase small subunit